MDGYQNSTPTPDQQPQESGGQSGAKKKRKKRLRPVQFNRTETRLLLLLLKPLDNYKQAAPDVYETGQRIIRKLEESQ
jgi:hypothetical protein